MPPLVPVLSTLAAGLAFALISGSGAPGPGDVPTPRGGGVSGVTAAASGTATAPVAQTVGTIEATLDGEARTWYVVSGEVGGQRQPGAFWMELGPGDRRAVVGGFDTEDFDYSGVELQGGMPVSLGSYEGSMLSITFPLEEGDTERTWTLPGTDATVSYVADAGAMDFSAMLVLEEGVVEATRIQTEGSCRFEGRFSGTLRPMGGEGDGMEIRDGTFQVEGCEELSPGGGR